MGGREGLRVGRSALDLASAMWSVDATQASGEAFTRDNGPATVEAERSAQCRRVRSAECGCEYSASGVFGLTVAHRSSVALAYG